MATSDRGIQHLKKSEGVVYHQYNDFVGLPTIGVGHLLTKSELMSGKIDLGDGRVIRWKDTPTLNDEQVEAILKKDLQATERYVEGFVDVPLSQNQFDSLVSFVFNIGPTAFRNSTLLRKLNAEDYESVPAEMRKWKYAGGAVQPILERRREEEIRLWTGE